MGVVQEAFDIPDDIAVGLASGLYKRMGGVVRWATGKQRGQIVKHLKPIDDASSVVEKAVRAGKANKKLAVGAAVVVTAAVVGGGAVRIVTAKKRSKFQKAFNRYIEAVREGNLEIEIIEDLENALGNMKSVQLTAEEMSVLVGHIRDYTIKMIENNHVEMKIEEPKTPVIDLKQYLEVQKSILKAA